MTLQASEILRAVAVADAFDEEHGVRARWEHLAAHTYDPEAGDYERNIPPGTPFEDLPDDWCCPECGA